MVTNNLTYNRTDYDGEVFRMNIVCDANTNVDCVFFKLNGTTDLTRGIQLTIEHIKHAM